MPEPLLCAHRCAHVQAGALREARSKGLPVEVVRISGGLSREYVPLSTTTLHACPGCTSQYTSPLAAALCCED